MEIGQPLKAIGSSRTSALLRKKDKGAVLGNKNTPSAPSNLLQKHLRRPDEQMGFSGTENLLMPIIQYDLPVF